MLAIRSHPLPEQAIGRQKVDVFAGLRHLKTLTWPKRGHGAHVHTVRLPSGIWRGDTAVLRFRIDRPMSPIEVGINGDPRVLGLFVQDIWVDPPMRDVVGNPLDLSSGGSIPAAMWRGWAKPEAEGCWTLGRRALLRWRASQPIGAGARVAIEIDAVAAGAKDLHGSISVNEAAGTPFRHRPGPSRFTVEVPVPGAIAAGEEVSVNLRIDNPRRPAHTLRNRDMRLLGLFVRRLWVEPSQRQS
jgi:hypothetical protein